MIVAFPFSREAIGDMIIDNKRTMRKVGFITECYDHSCRFALESHSGID